jgi:hypothetical protein
MERCWHKSVARFFAIVFCARSSDASPSAPHKTPPQKLLHSLKSTSASRFNAAKRLAAKDRALTRVTAFTSAYLIILTILPYFMKLPKEVADNLNLITVVFTIIILVSTLLQYSSGDVVSAEQHHRAGLEMSEIGRELANAMPTIVPQQLDDFTRRYSATLQKYSINHDDVDFQRYQMERPEEYPWLTWCERNGIRLRTFATRHTYSAILGVITAFFLLLVFVYVYPARIHSPAAETAQPLSGKDK